MSTTTTIKRWTAVGGAAAVLVGLLLLRGLPVAAGDFLDDIEVRIAEGIAEARIQFGVPVRYIRHFPRERGDTIEVHFEAVGADVMEHHGRTMYLKSPPADGVPCFTVSITHEGVDPVRDPFLMVIRFRKPQSFKFYQGGDQRSFSLYLPVVVDDTPEGEARKKYYDCP